VGHGRRGVRRARLQLGSAALLSVQGYLRRAAAQGRERRRAGCFEVFINPQRAAEGGNYAIPLAGCEPDADDVADLVGAFATAGRVPRLEYLPDTAPAAEAALLAGGFEVELRTPVMTCTPASLVVPPLPEGATLQPLDALSDPQDVRALVHTQQVAFGDEPDPDEPGLLKLPIAVLARVDGEPAGGGMGLVIAEGTTELAGIAVAERFRRRGLAGAITAELARQAFEKGALSAFLTPGDEGAQRVYARAGFVPTDVMLHLRRPPGATAPGPRR
jgi:GNAT superfamily N-acetyltransferase